MKQGCSHTDNARSCAARRRVIAGIVTALIVVPLIGVVISPHIARLVRNRLASELRLGYVTAERSTGASLLRIQLVHVSRNVAAPIGAYCLLLFADSMLFEAALSYVGVGIQPPQRIVKRPLTHQELQAKAFNLYLHLDSTREVNEISMFAENLGRLPPNTALMVVTDGTHRYEVFMSSSLTENATIRLRRRR